MDNQGNNPRYLTKFIQSVYIADGLEEDAEELIKRCLQSDVLSYHVFCNIWKDMNFSAMYQGRQSSCELAEVSEEAILIAKRYMTRVCENFEESVAGLFLVYAILRLQPFPRFAPLRITPEDIESTTYLEQTARKHNRYDVLYILGSLLIEGPCEFHVSAREYGLASNIRKNFDASSSVNKIGVRPRGVFNHRNEEMDLMRELSSLGKKYDNYKINISETGNMVADMNYYQESVSTDLSTSLRNLINGDVDLHTAGKRPDDVNDTTLCKRRQIKQRAMMNVVENMNHLTGLMERKNRHSPKKTKEHSPKKPNLKTKPGSIRTGNPKKSISAVPQKKTHKPATIISKRKGKISKNKMKISSDEDSTSEDDEIVIYDDSDVDVMTEEESEDYDEETIQTPAKKTIQPGTTSRKKTAPMSMDSIQTKAVQRKNKDNVFKDNNKICKQTKRNFKERNSIDKETDELSKDSNVKTCKGKKIIPRKKIYIDAIPKQENTIVQNQLEDLLKLYASKRQACYLNRKSAKSLEKAQNYVEIEINGTAVENIKEYENEI